MIALLIKNSSIDTYSISEYYSKPLGADVTVLGLIYNNPKTITAKTGKAWLSQLRIPETVTKLVVADAQYYKWIAGVPKVSFDVVKGKYPGYEKYEVVYVPNYQSLFKQPENALLITMGLQSLLCPANERVDVIHSQAYASSYGQDGELLAQLFQYPALTVDIETYGLDWNTPIATIAFAWDKHNGIVIDIEECGYHATKRFLEQYSGQLIMHNALFDSKLMIANWWMSSESDYQGMQTGLAVFQRVQDSMLTTYLAKNATTTVALDLKSNTLEYLGKYAIDVTDIRKHARIDLMKYNLYDCLGTWHVWEKYKEYAETETYTVILQPSIKPLLKMMLVGLPLSQYKVQQGYILLTAKAKLATDTLRNNTYVQQVTQIHRANLVSIANAKLKKVRRTIEDFNDIHFNPNSDQQLSYLLYSHLGLPVLSRTPTGQPATDADTLASLKKHTTDVDIHEIIDSVLVTTEAIKISGTFLKAFQGKQVLHGNLKLGGTQSGRLSSNSPNLQNLPSHGDMGKLIKGCVVAPPGYLIAGADFSSLEERIGAILSNDPNRIKCYTDGYDGHSLRAYRYFQDKMPDITEKLSKLDMPGKFYRVTQDNGSVQFFHETELPL